MTLSDVRRAALRLGALLVVLALAACASLPQSGPVRRGDPDVTEPGSIALLARLPDPGDGPEEIVDGFLRAAAAGLTDDFTIAREFLAQPARSEWDPLARVDVYSGQAALTSRGGDPAVVEATASVTALLDDAGRYTETFPGAEVRATFRLAQDDGEWRIVELVDGVLLSEPILRSLYQQVALSFVDPSGEALVSETRWFPRRSAETSAVAGLIAGPSPWLEEGAGSRFPPGTRLVVDTVTVRDGVAQVALSAEALEAGPRDRSLMLAQITETLTGLPRVQTVEVTVAGAPLEAEDVRSALVVDPSVGTAPAVLSGGRLAVVEGDEVVPWPESEPIAAPAPSHPAVPYGSGPPVVLSAGTAVVTVPVAGRPESTLLAGRTRLTPPSYDRLGWIWTARVTGESVHAFRADGTRVLVDADWLPGRDVRALRVSREGARALVVSVVAGAVRVEVAAVVRDATGTPLALGAPLQVGQRILAAATADWVDRQTVVVLGAVADGPADAVVLAVLGGPSSPLPPVPDAVALASGKGDRLVVVSTSSGVLHVRNGLSWTPTARDVRDPAFPG